MSSRRRQPRMVPGTSFVTADSVVPPDEDDGKPLPAQHPRSELFLAFLAGLVFAAGLTLGGMTEPTKVIGFLNLRELFVGDFPGQWDASLGLVMLGAVAISLIGFWLTPYASVRPWFTRSFMLPLREDVDARLIIGALIFGVGWGLSGYCPGPALASILTGQIDTAIFVMAMLPGMYLARKV